MYIKTKNCDWHLFMAELLIYMMPFTDAPYTFAFYHISEAIRICPNELKYKEFLIDNFYDYPESYLLQNDYVEIAKQILTHNPYHKKSSQIINENDV